MILVDSLKRISSLKPENLNGSKEITGGKIDSRKIESGDLYFCLKGRYSDGHEYIGSALNNGAIAAVVDRDYDNSSNYPVIYADDVELAMGSIAKVYRDHLKTTIILLTGSNGKTTTKEMIYSALSLKHKVSKTEGNLNNFQGLPLSIFAIDPNHEYAILEIGSNNFGEIKYLTDIGRPDYGLITNIGDAHLENFMDREGVLKEKIELFNGVKESGGVFFLNCDDPLLKRYHSSYNKIVTYGCGNYDYSFKEIDPTSSLSVKLELIDGETYKLGSIGSTSILNSRAAYTVLSYLGVDKESIAEGFLSFESEGFRQNLIVFGTTNIILDCYNANPTSMKESIENLIGVESKSIILGDMLELGSNELDYHIALSEIITPMGFDKIILVGERMKALYEKLKHKNLYWFKDSLSSIETVKSLNFDNETLLIKGSRSIGLETIYQEMVKV